MFAATACSGAFGFNNDYTVGSGGSSGSGCNYTGYVNYMLSLNPAGYWKLDETSGTSAADSSKNHDTGTMSGVKLDITPGPFPCAPTRPAMAFTDANGSKITTAATFADPLTYSEVVIFKASGYGTLMSFSDPTGDNDRIIYVGTDRKLYAGIFNNQGDLLTSPGPVVDGNWHIVIATESAAGMYLYLDGKQIAFNATYTTPQDFTGSWEIGWASSAYWDKQGAASFDGWIAQAAVTFPALTKAQVAKLASYAGL